MGMVLKTIPIKLANTHFVPIKKFYNEKNKTVSGPCVGWNPIS